jgi:alpha-tubulin suppressor-like RCC1 family protein
MRAVFWVTLPAAVGCGGGGTEPGPPPSPPQVEVQLVIAPPSVAVGGTLPVYALTSPAGTVTWTTETPGIASVNASGVTGLAPGTATIRATSGPSSRTGSLTVYGATFAELAIGPKHACARTANNLLYCWGSHASGMLGQVARTEVCLDSLECLSSPLLSPTTPTFVQVASGNANTCGRTATGEVHCWGSNKGQVLRTSSEVCSDGDLCSRAPVKVEGAPSFAWVGVGAEHFCGLSADGTAFCWGKNDFGQLGLGTTAQCVQSPCRQPAPVAGGLKFRSLALGEVHTCGITTAGQSYCWGWNFHGQLGSGQSTPFDGGEPAPVAVSGNLNFETLAPGRDHTCGITTTGQAYCWGLNATGQLGNGSVLNALAPRAVAGAIGFASITAGLEHTCALTGVGVAYCWGHNLSQASTTLGGQLGDGTFQTRLTPTLLVRAIPFAELDAGRAFTCGRTAAGAVYCWGVNRIHGQIGIGDPSKPSFTQPTGLGGIP